MKLNQNTKILQAIKSYLEALVDRNYLELLKLHNTPIIFMDKDNYFLLRNHESLSEFFQDIHLSDPIMKNATKADFSLNKVDAVSRTLYSCYVTVVFYDAEQHPISSKIINFGCLIGARGEVKIVAISFESGAMFISSTPAHKIQDGYVKYVV